MSDDGIPGDALEQLAVELTSGTTRRLESRGQTDTAAKLHEIEQQLQFPISGFASRSNDYVFSGVDVYFPRPFVRGAAHREGSLEYPHFTYGSQTSPPVGIHATVEEWLKDERTGAIIGARIAVASAGGEGEYTGIVHARFQGMSPTPESGTI